MQPAEYSAVDRFDMVLQIWNQFAVLLESIDADALPDPEAADRVRELRELLPGPFAGRRYSAASTYIIARGIGQLFQQFTDRVSPIELENGEDADILTNMKAMFIAAGELLP